MEKQISRYYHHCIFIMMTIRTQTKQRKLFMAANNEHVVYILKCKDNTLYTGYTNDFPRRLRMHEDGKGAKYTRGRGPFQVELIEQFQTKEEAMKKEYAIKQLI